LLDAMLFAGFQHVLGPDDGGSVVLVPIALHRRAYVDDGLRSPNSPIYRLGIAEVSHHDLGTVFDSLRDSPDEEPHAYSLPPQSFYYRTAKRAGSARHQYRSRIRDLDGRKPASVRL